MAARRLILLMVALLIASTVATAILRPAREPANETRPRTETARAPEPEPVADSGLPGGRLLKARISTRTRLLQVVPIELGDQIELTVSGPTAGLVRIPAYGTSERVDRFSPARFDLLPRTAGRATIRFRPDDGDERAIGAIAVLRRD